MQSKEKKIFENEDCEKKNQFLECNKLIIAFDFCLAITEIFDASLK
jgi:hypothetical protein